MDLCFLDKKRIVVHNSYAAYGACLKPMVNIGRTKNTEETKVRDYKEAGVMTAMLCVEKDVALKDGKKIGTFNATNR